MSTVAALLAGGARVAAWDDNEKSQEAARAAGLPVVDLKAAESLAIPVFNSPFSNSRSVAELIIAHIINLSRFIGDQAIRMHKGEWNKVSALTKRKRNETAHRQRRLRRLEFFLSNLADAALMLRLDSRPF